MLATRNVNAQTCTGIRRRRANESQVSPYTESCTCSAGADCVSQPDHISRCYQTALTDIWNKQEHLRWQTLHTYGSNQWQNNVQINANQGDNLQKHSRFNLQSKNLLCVHKHFKFTKYY